MRITLAGQDITAYVCEIEPYTMNISSMLGQGAGVSGGASGRAATATFHTTLGPAATAAGAGQSITHPQLVRMGEVKVYDQTNTLIFGGYVGKLTDITERTQVFTQVDCYDYWQHLDRIMINMVFNGNSDIYMIKAILTKYVPWIDQSALPASAAYTFASMVLKNMSVQKAIQKITDVVGFAVWVDVNKQMHYTSPLNAPVAPFSVSSSPDFVSSFPHKVVKYELDDTSAINQVSFYGGRKPSSDFTQDISVQVTGTQTVFTLAYYPHEATDGKFHVQLNGGRDLVLGRLSGSDTTKVNKLKKDGGLCDVLINTTTPGTLTFNTPPAKGSTLTCRYRYELPLLVSITDRNSYAFFGQYLGANISDQTVFDPAIATQRCNILLSEQSYGLTTIELEVYKPSLVCGQLLHVVNSVRGINQTLMIQEVTPIPKGAGVFYYKVVCGAWHWNIVDVVMTQAVAQSFNASDLATTTDTIAADVEQDFSLVKSTATFHVTSFVYTYPFYPRTTALSDTHDAYPGIASI